MKVVHIQLFEKVGGSEKFIYQLSEQQIAKGLEVSVFFITTKESHNKYTNFFKSFENINCRIELINYQDTFKSFFQILYSLNKKFRKIRPSIIHIHLIHAEIYVAILKCLMLLTSKTIVQKHGYNENALIRYFNEKYINKVSAYWILSKISFMVHDRTYTISKYFSNFFYDVKISNKPLEYIYHGLFNINKTDLDNSISPVKYFCVIARLDAIKGHDLLIDSIYYLKSLDKKIDFKIMFLGDGSEKLKIMHKIKQLGLSNIIELKGYVSNVHEMIRNSIAVILPSKIEPFGLTILEAYQNNKCTLAFDVPSLNEVILDQKTGYLIEPYSIKELGKKIYFLANNPDEAERMGNYSGSYVRNNFSLEVMVNQTLKLYNNVCL
jgi:glycosyltransferase involved in cell wall biosynthesis